LAVLPGCSGTVGDGFSRGAQGDDGKTGRGGVDVPGLGSDGIEDVEAFLDAQRAAAMDTSHAASLTQTADGTFEDGDKALELRAWYDPSSERLRVQRWRRRPDGDRSGVTELYTDGSEGARRTVVDGEVRLDAVPESTARERYTDLRENVRRLLAALRYGSKEPVEDTVGEYRLPVEGTRGEEYAQVVESVGTSHLLLTGAGLLQALELDDFVEARAPERSTELTFEVTDLGETSVSEPDWFERALETTSDGHQDGDGEGGPAETSASGADATVLVGPGGDLVFEPAELEVAPGETVQWVWRSDTHNVQPTDQPAGADWDGAPDIANDGTTYEHTFDVEGEYAYVCEPHAAVGMEGEIVVESQ
jgi:plastocyanin